MNHVFCHEKRLKHAERNQHPPVAALVHVGELPERNEFEEKLLVELLLRCL